MNILGAITATAIIYTGGKRIAAMGVYFRQFFLLTSVIVGRLYEEDTYLNQGAFPSHISEVWRQPFGFLFSFVFAGPPLEK